MLSIGVEKKCYSGVNLYRYPAVPEWGRGFSYACAQNVWELSNLTIQFRFNFDKKYFKKVVNFFQTLRQKQSKRSKRWKTGWKVMKSGVKRGQKWWKMSKWVVKGKKGSSKVNIFLKRLKRGHKRRKCQKVVKTDEKLSKAKDQKGSNCQQTVKNNEIWSKRGCKLQKRIKNS